MKKDIEGYEGLYEIHDNATVVNKVTGKELKTWLNNKGYRCIDLYKNGERAHMLLHRLMAEAFVPNPKGDPIVLHLDNDKLNLSPDNLSWGTYSENNAQAIRDGINTMPRPDNRKDYVFTDGSSDAIPAIYYHGMEAIVKRVGTKSSSSVKRILRSHKQISEGPYAGFYVEKRK